MDTEDQKLETIRKLLAKAERAATSYEADVYNSKAAEIMAKHGVDAAMVASSGEKQDVIGSRRITMTDPYSTEKATLAGCVAATSNCRVVRHPGFGRGQTAAVTVMGFESDLNRVELTYTSLLLQATRSLTRQRPPAWSKESTTAFRRTWLIGFAAEVHRRLTDAGTSAVRDHDAQLTAGRPSAALVLADRRSLVDRAYDEQFGNLRTARPRKLSGTGYRAGAEAGRRADVGHKRVESVRRAIDRG
ncbi:DUF2786 domain-containing protein [Pseudonocardia sediminis]|uniref:DUF2786 domain-containing protein n=1 Tax=Pseudonocardia sediminis TaxID=1397368 RepID=UPI00102A135E|nr:DUF2786 domain-containing protein [Pseudonocardia sediminis]